MSDLISSADAAKRLGISGKEFRRWAALHGYEPDQMHEIGSAKRFEWSAKKVAAMAAARAANPPKRGRPKSKPQTGVRVRQKSRRIAKKPTPTRPQSE